MTDSSAIRRQRRRPQRRSACWCCKAAARSAPIRPAPIRRCVTMISSRNGSPASRSAPSTPRSSPATRRDKRVERLKEFWEMVSAPVPWNPIATGDRARSLFNETSAALIATFGVPGFFTPRFPPAPLWPPGSPQSQSYYDTAPLEETLERLVDFDRINDLKTRLSVGAVERDLGQFQIFRQFRVQEARQEDRAGTHHGLRRAAAGLSFRRDRGRALSGTAASPPTRRSIIVLDDGSRAAIS